MILSSAILPSLARILPDHAISIGYSVPMLQYGFSRMFAHWNPTEFAAFSRQELPDLPDLFRLFDTELSLKERKSLFSVPCAKNLLIVSASTVPSAAFQDVIFSLLLPLHVTHRPAHNLLSLFLALREDLSHTAPHLSERWEILPPVHDDAALTDVLSRHDVVSVSGSDRTIAHYQSIAQSLHPQPRIIAHGHRVSAAILRREDLSQMTDRDYSQLALDASVWDQSGCLSPKCLFVESSDRDVLRKIAQTLVTHLDAVAELLPALPVQPQESAARNSAMRMALLDGPELFRAPRNHDLVLLWPSQSPVQPLLYPRTLHIYPVGDALRAAAQFAPHGQALASRTPISPEQERQLSLAGYNDFCRFGQMQDPPLTWFHDGIGTLRPLWDF